MLAKPPQVVSLDPACIGDVLDDVRRVARATGTEAMAAPLVAAWQARIDAVTQRAASARHRPRVLHLEWADPPMCGGHWVPEMVDMAGGINCFGDPAGGSFPLDWADVIASQPEVIVLMPCGFNVERALQDVPGLVAKEGWESLPAVQNTQVYAIDAGAYTSRSGPRLVTGLEMLAAILHPELFSNATIPAGGALRLSEEMLKAP
jgi:iron complex transport system substrate-binding protein